MVLAGAAADEVDVVGAVVSSEASAGRESGFGGRSRSTSAAASWPRAGNRRIL